MPASVTKTKSGADRIKDRARVTDIICDVMHSHFRDLSIDTLLTWPHKAIEMAKLVCKRIGCNATEEKIHEICRTALSSRKRGDLKRDRY